MIKHYYIDTGISRTHPFRRFIIATLSLSALAFGAYSFILNPAKAQTIEENKPALNQVSQPPAAAAQPRFTTAIPWPGYGHSAYFVPKDGLFATSDTNAQTVPVASLAKVITALAILQKQPLKSGEQGPMITLKEQDIAIYTDYVRKNGTVIPIEVGEQISQYQALQAILMVSANNMSDSLVIQIFGSMEAYVVYANQMLKNLGLDNTIVADASGYSPKTFSTAENMAKLGYIYMQNPVLREIAYQPDATLPFTGKIKNYNAFMNEEGVVGIKVGDTDEAGKCFMVANIRKSESGSEELSIAVVLGAESLKIAAKDAQIILKAGNKSHDQLATTP